MVKETIILNKIIELTNLEIFEYCTLNRLTGEANFFKSEKKSPGFTGLYFRNDETFYAIYPTEKGPIIFYNNKEYDINGDLSIELIR